MTSDRHLDWDGCHNVRDLGGLPTAGGGRVRWGALVRADALDRLSARGWEALEAHGIGTVIDLRNPDERTPDRAPRPAAIDTLHVPLDATESREFWAEWGSGPQIGTPLYWGPFLERFPERATAVVVAVARARPGGVVFHCRIGRDRTGLVALLLLGLLGVAPEHIADDHELSAERVRALLAAMGEDSDHERDIAEEFARRGTTARDTIVATLGSVDVEAYLRRHGVAGPDLAALRERLVG